MEKGGLTYKQVSERYGVHENTVYKWVKKGLLKPSRFVGRVYFTEAALTEFERRAKK